MINADRERLARRIFFLDGAMGTSVQECDLDLDRDFHGKENCTEILVQTRPDIVQQIHESYLAVGSDIVETNTFGANKLVLAEFDLVDQTRKLNEQAVQIARAACEKYTSKNKPRFVAGSIGPGTKLVTLGHTDWDTIFDSYLEQVRGLLDGGVDLLLIETAQDLLQIKVALNACLQAMGERGQSADDVPMMVQVTIETTGTMLLGTEIAAAASALSNYPILSLGLNCATGPAQMVEHVQWLGRHWPGMISVVPNAGMPALVDGQTRYPLEPPAFAQEMLRFVDESGVNIVGGCCGTTPQHIEQLVEAIGERPPAVMEKERFKAGCTSLYNTVDYRQDVTILNIGERCNASGSRQFKQLLETGDIDGMVSLAKAQVKEGSHIIDVNVDYAGRDNAADMSMLVSRLMQHVSVPLMLDSTQPATIEAGLKHAAGKCLINSANLEDGEEKLIEMCDLATRYGTGLVLGCIDEDPEEAMARTADRKVAIAQRMHDLVVKTRGLVESDILFDPLVLPISTGMDKDRRSALETIEGTRRIAELFPHCQLTCGLSNVSFGLKAAARLVLNSVFLHELVQAGMTSAIVHVSKILPKNRIDNAKWEAALNLIYDRHDEALTTLSDGTETNDPLQIFINLFDDTDTSPSAKTSIVDLPLEERLRTHIIDGEKQGLIESLEEALKKYTALDIINDHLLDGMKVVGELFGSGQMQLPFVLQSAEVMKNSVAHLQPHMEKVRGQSKGVIVLATVRGDVHDIGKNLVDIILSNNGYTVHNLGIKQPISSILDAQRLHGANAIGLSGLLVKSVNVMQDNLNELNAQQVTVPVLLGGAALSRHYAEGHLRSIYAGDVFYGKDAFEGLRVMHMLTTGRTDELNKEVEGRVSKRAAGEKRVAALDAERVEFAPGTATAVATRIKSDVTIDIDVPTPPFWGSRVVAHVPLDEVYTYINTTALFRGQWQFKKGSLSDDAYEETIQQQAIPVFNRLQEQCADDQILHAKVVYGYYACQSEDDTLIIFDPQDHDRAIERLAFPRQSKQRRLCISDFFRSVDTGKKDVIALHCVTVGSQASVRARQLFENNEYQQYLYLHGFGVECAEALAEMWHQHIRRELAIADDDSSNMRELFTQHYRGSRYSFGYPACPELADQQILFRMLRPGRIGCVLTENWQIDPEQSTSAIIVHHPQAKYFRV